MAAAPSAADAELHGRRNELAALAAALDDARAGAAGAVLVIGEAGVGKTALVRAATAGHDDVVVGFGRCLPLLSARVPFLALRDALRTMPGEPGAPALPDGTDLARALGDVDEWITAVALDRPVVLVVDDVQWADPATLDVLTFLIAGPAARRLAVVMTLRTEQAHAGVLPRWLAGIRRLPRMTELALAPLGREAIEDLIADVVGGRPHQSLVDEALERGGGNPLLTRLLVSGAAADDRHLSHAIGGDLRAAVLGAWTALDARSRQAATALAVGGGPHPSDDLATVLGLPVADIAARLGVATDAGLVEELRDGSLWFRHPLHAEVLEETMTAQERARLHTAFADQYERSAGGDDAMTLVRIADHRYAAGDASAAYDAALRASARLESLGGWHDATRLLRRAIRLSGELDRPRGESRFALLRRLCTAAANDGAHAAELDATEELLRLPETAQDRQLDVALRVRRMHLRFNTGRAFFEMAEALEILAAAEAVPGTAAHALALAEYAHATAWHEVPDAAAVGAAALREARANGDAVAVSFASTACSMIDGIEQRQAAALVRAVGAVEAAFRARHWWACSHAVLWEGNAREVMTSPAYALVMRDRRARMQAAGAPHAYLAFIAGAEADAWVACGHPTEAAACLRAVFASDPGPVADVAARLAAARLAARQGRPGEAAQQLARVTEIFDDPSAHTALAFDATETEVLVAAGEYDAAVQSAKRGLRLYGLAPTLCEWLLPLAARALVERIEASRGSPDDAEAARIELRALRRVHPHIVRDVGFVTPLVERQAAALDALYAAEVAQGLGEETIADRWLATASALARAQLPWEEAHALSRAAAALVAHLRERRTGGDVLREALEKAQTLGAEPIVIRMRALARAARITLRAPTPVEIGAGFTPREREVLAYVVAGRTYAEIARALTISEKTVSTHISHLLAKTGSASRVELADFAERAQVG